MKLKIIDGEEYYYTQTDRISVILEAGTVIVHADGRDLYFRYNLTLEDQENVKNLMSALAENKQYSGKSTHINIKCEGET